MKQSNKEIISLLHTVKQLMRHQQKYIAKEPIWGGGGSLLHTVKQLMRHQQKYIAKEPIGGGGGGGGIDMYQNSCNGDNLVILYAEMDSP